MRTKDFMEQTKCSKSTVFRFMEAEDRSSLLFAQLMSTVCNIVGRISGEKEITIDMLPMIRKKTDDELEMILNQFKAAWVGGSENQLMKKKKLVRKLYNRFMDWFLGYVNGCKVEAVNKKVLLCVEQKGVPVTLEETAHILLKKDGGYVAVVLNVGKNYEKRSMNGRSFSTRIECDLRYAVLKSALEEKYQGVNIAAVFFQEGETKGELLPWVNNGTQKSNIFIMPFIECYEDGGNFDAELCLSNAESSLNEYANRRQTDKCNNCVHKSECQMQTYSERKLSEKHQKEWKFPKYDEEQKNFIEFKDGELLVLAGPGAGKTSSTIGRVECLRKSGVPTEKMLLISYTEKAAGEISDRLYGKYPEDEMPRIGTLHSVAREVIWLYEKKNNIPRKNCKKLLTQAKEKGMVKKVLDSYPELTGVDYRNYIGGRYDTVSVVYEGLKNYIKSPEYFFLKHRDYVPDEWERFSAEVETLKDKECYISYDEQISMAVDILDEEPAIRNYYHQKYEYIMVDEYQDINAEQERLINLLESSKKNLVCIGDDDQAIYGFRGCSSKYMQEFLHRHPGAICAKLTKNYRSTRKIVEFNNSLLQQMNKEQRIEKVVEYTEYAKEGNMPILLNGNSAGEVQRCIEEALREGYKLDDIAVIATKNDSLRILKDSLSVPTELASAYVVNDFLFHVVRNTLAVVLGVDETFNSYNRLGLLFEKDEKWFAEVQNLGKEPAVDIIGELLTFARKLRCETPEHYVARISAFLDMDDSPSEEAVLALVRNSGAGNLEELHQVLAEMVLFGDDKKLEYMIYDKVTLITAHSCKGKEWPVVIVYDTEAFNGEVSTDGKNSMDLRLLYVSASRAKERLIFMKALNSVSVIDDNLLVKRSHVRVS